MVRRLYYLGAAIGLLGIIIWVAFSSNPVVRRQPSSGLVSLVQAESFGAFSPNSISGRNQTATSLPTQSLTDTPSTDAKIDSPPSTTIQYSYDGSAIPLPAIPVLRRDPNMSIAATTLSSFTRGANWLNLNSFSSLQAESITVAETTDDGYSLTIDYLRGTASLYRRSSATTVQARPNANQQAATSMTNTTAIGLARGWLERHGVSLEHTGTPVVQTSMGVAAAERSSDLFYLDPYLTIIFPWLVNDLPVVDQSGNPYGLQVTLDTTVGVVISASNITNLHFTGSDYPLITSWDAVVDTAERGGLYGAVAAKSATTVGLSAPHPAYMVSTYQLSNDGLDYLVPAIVFSIDNVSDGTPVYQSAIVVPLVNSLYDTSNAGIAPDQTTIEPAVTSGSSGSTTPSQ